MTAAFVNVPVPPELNVNKVDARVESEPLKNPIPAPVYWPFSTVLLTAAAGARRVAGANYENTGGLAQGL